MKTAKMTDSTGKTQGTVFEFDLSAGRLYLGNFRVATGQENTARRHARREARKRARTRGIEPVHASAGLVDVYTFDGVPAAGAFDLAA